jgi:peptide-methionine (S)-S-oxide reductase
MSLHLKAVHGALLAAIMLAQVAAAQERAATASDPERPVPSSAPKKSSAGKTRARNNDLDAGKLASSGPSSATMAAPKSELATFGAGCFWHVEDVFERQKGVRSAVSGYSGGGVPYPTYEMVHTGQTGHAECVQVEYDPDVISFEDLLKIFWRCHDPTSINRQGEDEGPQYRSVIFYHSEAQRKAALKSYDQLTRARVFRLPIVTQLVPMQAFFPAEDYHQNYYSGLRRPPSRRRKPAATKSKAVQRRSTIARRPAQNAHGAAAAATQAPSAEPRQRADSPHEADPSGPALDTSADDGTPKQGG